MGIVGADVIQRRGDGGWDCVRITQLGEGGQQDPPLCEAHGGALHRSLVDHIVVQPQVLSGHGSSSGTVKGGHHRPR